MGCIQTPARPGLNTETGIQYDTTLFAAQPEAETEEAGSGLGAGSVVTEPLLCHILISTQTEARHNDIQSLSAVYQGLLPKHSPSRG